MTTEKMDGRGDEDGAPALEDDQLFDARRWIDGDVDALTRTETRESSSGASVVIERRAVRREGDDESSAVPYVLARARRRRDEDALLVYMHRTGSSKEGVFEHLLRYASEDGWHAVSFDAPGHGERAEADADYATTLSRAYYAMGERDAVRRYGTSPFVIDAAIDCLRVTRAAVRVTGATRVALAGESLGGMVATCAAAAWTPAWGFAVDACAPMIGFSYFQYGLANERWFERAASLPAALWMRVSKGERDAPTLEDARAFYARACPDLCGGSRDGDRALTRVRANKIHFFAVNGSEDARNPLQGVREACARHDAPNKYRDARSQCVVVARKGVGHDITDEMRDVVRGFLRRVRENPTAPEMETFDEREWDVALAAPARPEPESCLAKLKRWAEDEGEDAYASYLSEDDRAYLSRPASSIGARSTGVDAVERLLAEAKKRAAVEYVSPHDVARREKAARDAEARAEAERARRDALMVEREAAARDAEALEATRIREAREGEDAKRRADEALEKARKEGARARAQSEAEARARAQRETEDARRAAGVARVRELLSRRTAMQEDARRRVMENVSDKILENKASIRDRLQRVKSAHEARQREDDEKYL